MSDNNAISTESVAPTSTDSDAPDSNTTESKDDSNTNDEYAEAITTVTELLNKLNSAAANASADDADDFKKAIDIATEMLNKLNANPVAPVAPVLIPVPPVLIPVTDGPVVDGTDAPNGCGQRAALLSSADDSCFVVKDMPPIAQMIQAAFANEVSTAGREIVMNFLKAAGIQGIESAVLTPETIRQLDELSKNPEMKAKITALKLNLDNVAEQAMNNIENKVLPKAEKVLGGIESNALNGAADAIKGAGLGELVAVAKEAEAIAGVANELPAIGTEITKELKPLQDLKNSIPVLPDVPALPAVPDVPALPAVPDVPDVAGTLEATGAAAASTASDAASGAASDATNAAASTASDAASAGTLEATGTKPVVKGGSRRIHRLSRRIDKLSRRIQKKYGLKDKNSFLRRTLKK